MLTLNPVSPRENGTAGRGLSRAMYGKSRSRSHSCRELGISKNESLVRRLWQWWFDDDEGVVGGCVEGGRVKTLDGRGILFKRAQCFSAHDYHACSIDSSLTSSSTPRSLQ